MPGWAGSKSRAADRGDDSAADRVGPLAAGSPGHCCVASAYGRSSRPDRVEPRALKRRYTVHDFLMSARHELQTKPLGDEVVA
jgi:hypothetical protein